jgi:hypothetical protein
LSEAVVPKAKVGGTGVIRDQYGNIKQEFVFSGETELSEQELRQKLIQEQKNGSHPHHIG